MSIKICVIPVDLQNCFGDPKGGLYVPGAEKIIPNCNKLIREAVKKRWALIFSKDWHPENMTEHFKKFPPHGIANTWDSEFLHGLHVPGHATIVYKGTNPDDDGFDPFEGKASNGSDMNEIIQWFGDVDVYIVFGIATEHCDKAAVLSALKRSKLVYFVRDASAAVNANPGDEEKAIEEMKAAGATIVTTEEVLKWEVLKWNT